MATRTRWSKIKSIINMRLYLNHQSSWQVTTIWRLVWHYLLISKSACNMDGFNHSITALHSDIVICLAIAAAPARTPVRESVIRVWSTTHFAWWLGRCCHCHNWLCGNSLVDCLCGATWLCDGAPGVNFLCSGGWRQAVVCLLCLSLYWIALCGKSSFDWR